jgi:SAM-dependent methyltransferase
MTGDGFAESRHARMRWNAPLSEPHADQLLSLLDLHPGHDGLHVADLGCGWGELLLKAAGRAAGHELADGITAGPLTGTGVDTDPLALERGRRRARDLGLDGQVRFVQDDAAAWTAAADVVLCVGSAHAFGGTRPALDRLARVVAPGGQLLFGDGGWAVPPTPAALEIIGPGILPLARLPEEGRAAGWKVTHMSTASLPEWDDFESSFRAGRQDWLLTRASDPRAAEVREWLGTREREYLQGYRGVLGFAYLILEH